MESAPGRFPTGWTLLGIACAAGASTLLALVAAIGPAHSVRSEYTWPPPRLPADEPARGWYAPLPLLNRVPESIDVHLPCGLPGAAGKQRAVTVFATARHPRTQAALHIETIGSSLRIGVGNEDLLSESWPAACPLRIEVRDGQIRLPSRSLDLHLGTLNDMPVVTGLFTNLDLQAGKPPHVVLLTRAYTTTFTTLQVVADCLTAVLAVFALLGVAFGGSRRPRRRTLSPQAIRRALGSFVRRLDGADAVVVAVLLVWWIIAPTFTDDGWLWIEDRTFHDLGTITFYFDNWGLVSPLGYWIEWLRHWVVGATSNLVWMRLPTLLVLLVSWPICKWCVRTIVPLRTSVVRWTLAGAFLVNATAWGMTLRLEPVVSLLIVISLAAMCSFVRTPRFAPLTVALPAAVLAANAHPAGFVGIAPVLSCIPSLWRWLRSGGRQASILFGSLVSVALAIGHVLFTLDADLSTRLRDGRLIREGDLHSEPWYHEYIRYTHFDAFGGGTAIRRLSLALLLLAALSSLARRPRRRPDILALPGQTVAIALVLLAFVPSKWPWHFGTLVAVGAIAVAVEAARLVREGSGQHWFRLREIVALGAVAAVALWAWWAPVTWTYLDLQTLEWNDGFNRYAWLAFAALLLALVLVEIALLVREGLRGGPRSLLRVALLGLATATLLAWWAPGRSVLDLKYASWRDGFNKHSLLALVVPVLVAAVVAGHVHHRRGTGARFQVGTLAAWAIPFVSLLVIGVTSTLLIADASRTHWSTAGQNLEALGGRTSCGLADRLSNPPRAANAIGDPSARTLLIPSLALYFPCARVPEPQDGVVQVPRYIVYEYSAWPLLVDDGPFAAVRDLYATRLIAQGPREIGVLSVSESVPGFARADAVRVGA